MTNRDDIFRIVPIVKSIMTTLGLRDGWKSMLFELSLELDPDDLAGIRQSKEYNSTERLGVSPLSGLSFEQISVLYEFSLAASDPTSRKELGQYFTPEDTADFMAGLADAFPKGIWLDPCSSLGSLSYHLALRMPSPKDFLKKNLLLMDLDDLALLLGRGLFSLFFKSKNLFFELEKRFIVGDYLNEENRPKHDFVIMNPPYAVVSENLEFESSKSRDLYAYFMERAAKTTRGFIAVTPQSFTNGRKFAGLRRVLLRESKSLDIFCFDNVPDAIFRGYKFGSTNSNTANSTRAAITCSLQETKVQRLRITPMLRWRSFERAEIFRRAGDFLNEIPRNFEKFPKLSKQLSALYEETLTWQNIGSISQTEESRHSLLVATTPRYFVSATIRSLSRSSCRTIYFATPQARDLAYLTLNSSIAYWWWRVHDGGMTLSEQTLMSTPIPPSVENALHLVSELKESESSNLVTKLNSGKINENIKHPLGLIDRLNRVLLPQYALSLLNEHRNTSL